MELQTYLVKEFPSTTITEVLSQEGIIGSKSAEIAGRGEPEVLRYQYRFSFHIQGFHRELRLNMKYNLQIMIHSVRQITARTEVKKFCNKKSTLKHIKNN